MDDVVNSLDVCTLGGVSNGKIGKVLDEGTVPSRLAWRIVAPSEAIMIVASVDDAIENIRGAKTRNLLQLRAPFDVDEWQNCGTRTRINSPPELRTPMPPTHWQMPIELAAVAERHRLLFELDGFWVENRRRTG